VGSFIDGVNDQCARPDIALNIICPQQSILQQSPSDISPCVFTVHRKPSQKRLPESVPAYRGALVLARLCEEHSPQTGNKTRQRNQDP